MVGTAWKVCSGIGVAAAVLALALFLRPAPPSSPPAASSTSGTASPASDSDPLAPDKGPELEPAEYPRLPEAERGAGVRVWSVEELAEHSGKDDSKPLLIAIIGDVFDVGPGARFYAPGKGYEVFGGQDASNGFAGLEEKASSNLADLDTEGVAEVIRWRDQFYRTHEEYRFVGVLAERYYDERGEPTAELDRIEGLKFAVAKVEEARKELDRRFMTCNSQHQADKPFFEIWCDDSYHKPGSRPLHLFFVLPPALLGGEPERGGRCACVPPSDLAAAEAEAQRGVTRAPEAAASRLVEYAECQKEQRCQRLQGAPAPPEPQWA